MFGKKKQLKADSAPAQTEADIKQSQAEVPPVQVDVYTLPEKFLPANNTKSSKKKSNKLMYILLAFLVLVIAGGAGAWFYFKNKSAEVTPSPATNIAPLNENVTEEEASEEEPVVETVPEPIIYVAKDFQDEVIGVLNIELSAQDFDLTDQIEISSTKTSIDNPKVIGTVYRITPSGYSLKDKAVLRISYFDTDLSSLVENSLRIGYEEVSGEWRVAESSVVDLNKNEVSLEIMQIPRTRIAIVSNLTLAELGEPEEDIIQPSSYEIKELKSSLDTDDDLLTDVEEIMYGTSFDQPDSDGDGYIDGQEMMNFYSPKEAGQKLMDSDLFTYYKNDKFQYEVIYPQTWSPNSVDENGSVIIFNSPTSQFFEIVVEEKDMSIDNIVDWYAKQLPGLDKDELRHTIVGQDIEAIYSLDGSTIYFIYNDWVVALSYNLGIEQEADYLTTWKILIKSWKSLAVDQEETDESSTATSTPTNQ